MPNLKHLVIATIAVIGLGMYVAFLINAGRNLPRLSTTTIKPATKEPINEFADCTNTWKGPIWEGGTETTTIQSFLKFPECTVGQRYKSGDGVWKCADSPAAV